MKKLILIILFLFSSVSLFAQSPLPAPLLWKLDETTSTLEPIVSTWKVSGAAKIIVKTSDTGFTNTTTYQNDGQLYFVAEAGEYYLLEIYLSVSGGGALGAKFSITTTNRDVTYSPYTQGLAGHTGTTSLRHLLGTYSHYVNGHYYTGNGIVIMAGFVSYSIQTTVYVTYAQETADATSTYYVKSGSWLRYQKL